MRTLVLTREFTPHKIVEWDRALMMLFQGKIEVIEEHEEVLGVIASDRIREFKQVAKAYSQRVPEGNAITIRTPSVVRLWSKIGGVKRSVKFSRLNVFTRDGFRCQYCGESKSASAINYDHVIPKQRGGKTVWENIVTSCYPCNSRKANRTPSEAGMKLLHQPHKPKSLPLVGPKFDPKSIHPSWLPYIISLWGDRSSLVA